MGPRFMSFRSFLFLVSLLGWFTLKSASGQAAAPAGTPANSGDAPNNRAPLAKIPSGVILVKGAWSSASDSVTPIPEGAIVRNHIFHDQYFGMTYPLPQDWMETYKGPPPSDTGRYVLAQLASPDSSKEPGGNILITAQDLFFSPVAVSTAEQLVRYLEKNLQTDYKVEIPPAETTIAGRRFSHFAYWSPVAEMHWYVLATDNRCHAVEMVVSSRDKRSVENLVQNLRKENLFSASDSRQSGGASASPVCIKDYVREENLVARADPIFTGHRFNSVPVRIIVDKRGKVRHIHFLSAFPDQAKAISDALRQWRFKPYRLNGKPVEVETGVLFGLARTFPPSEHAEAPGAISRDR
jgi:hypothetical protein